MKQMEASLKQGGDAQGRALVEDPALSCGISDEGAAGARNKDEAALVALLCFIPAARREAFGSRQGREQVSNPPFPSSFDSAQCFLKKPKADDAESAESGCSSASCPAVCSGSRRSPQRGNYFYIHIQNESGQKHRE